MQVSHRQLRVNGISIHVAECGDGPLVLMVHGFPELWYSWRHQLQSVADAGYHAVALDLRGFGGSDRPASTASYTRLHYVGDLVGIVHALQAKTAVLVGHDWGAPICWTAAQMRPDLFIGIFALSVPFAPRTKTPPMSLMKRTATEEFYQLYFSRPGVAELAYDRDPRDALLRTYWGGSAEGRLNPEVIGSGLSGMVPINGGRLAALPRPDRLPSWLSEDDLQVYTEAFTRTGFATALNLYRDLDRSWELLAPLDGRRVLPTAYYMAGDRDLVLGFAGIDRVIAALPENVPNLLGYEIVPDCGHWIQQEKAELVGDRLVGYLSQVATRTSQSKRA